MQREGRRAGAAPSDGVEDRSDGVGDLVDGAVVVGGRAAVGVGDDDVGPGRHPCSGVPTPGASGDLLQP